MIEAIVPDVQQAILNAATWSWMNIINLPWPLLAFWITLAAGAAVFRSAASVASVLVIFFAALVLDGGFYASHLSLMILAGLGSLIVTITTIKTRANLRRLDEENRQLAGEHARFRGQIELLLQSRLPRPRDRAQAAPNKVIGQSPAES